MIAGEFAAFNFAIGLWSICNQASHLSELIEYRLCSIFLCFFTFVTWLRCKIFLFTHFGSLGCEMLHFAFYIRAIRVNGLYLHSLRNSLLPCLLVCSLCLRITLSFCRAIHIQNDQWFLLKGYWPSRGGIWAQRLR